MNKRKAKRLQNLGGAPHLQVQRPVNIPKGVAEFVRKYKRQFHALGCMDFDLPFGAKLPAWLEVVFQTLASRERTWRVQELAPIGFEGIKYRVYWRGWMKQRPTGRPQCSNDAN